jgi:hypothetical protein
MDNDVNVSPDDLTFAMFVLPPVISLINQKYWRDEVRALVAMGVCLVYSFVVTFLRADLSFTQWRDTVLQVFVGAFGAYKLFWRPSDIGPSIEAATTFGKGPADRDVTVSGDNGGESPTGLPGGP